MAAILTAAIPTTPTQAEPREKPPAASAAPNPWGASDALRWISTTMYNYAALAAKAKEPPPPRAARREPAEAAPTEHSPPPPPAGGWSANWWGVAECESGNDWSYNGPSGFDGGLQFSPSTWTAYGGGEFAPYAWGASPEQQMTVAERVKAGQGMGAWPHCRIYG